MTCRSLGRLRPPRRSAPARESHKMVDHLSGVTMAKKAKKSAKKAPKNIKKKTAKKAGKAGAKKSGTKKKDGRSNPRSWSKNDIKQLKTLIKENTPTRLIAMKIK